MVEFVAELNKRVLCAWAALRQAHDAGDHYAVTVHRGDLDELLRLAADNGIASPLPAGHV
jgi:hypothetical protein